MEEIQQSPVVEEQQTTMHRSTLIKYLVLFSIASIILSAIIGGIIGGIAGGVVAKFFPNNGTVQNQPLKVVNEQSAVIDAVKKANPAVVSIIISKNLPSTYNPLDPFGFLNNGGSGGTSQQEVGGGSGFIITSDGLIVTNKHVASDTSSTYTVILTSGKQYNGKIVATDPTNDISIIKIEASNLPTVTLASSTSLQLGESVIAIGNALGQYQNTVDVGVVSGINRVVTASDPTGNTNETLHNVIQTDAQINPGNSGGPLLNLEGQVIGINTAVAQNAQGIGFAIPIDQAKADITQVQSTGKIIKPELGVRYIPIDNNYIAAHPNIPYTYGAIVTTNDSSPAVVSGSPADKAGIVSGDIILEVNGVKIDDTNSLASLIQSHNVGDTITLKIYHNNAEKTVSVKLDQAFSSQ